MPLRLTYRYAEGTGKHKCSGCGSLDADGTRFLVVPGVIHVCLKCWQTLGWGMDKVVTYSNRNGWIMDPDDLKGWIDPLQSGGGGDFVVDVVRGHLIDTEQKFVEVVSLIEHHKIVKGSLVKEAYGHFKRLKDSLVYFMKTH